MVRQDSQMLIGTVYLDMQETAWAVAVAYNQSRAPGLHGHENSLEVRYTYTPTEKRDHEHVPLRPRHGDAYRGRPICQPG